MAIRADSYSTTSEVKAYTRHLLDGQSTFNSTTRPTLTDLEKFIDRASGILNLALATYGFMPAAVRANSTAKLPADDWVTARAAEYAELTRRGTGYSDGEGSRTGTFASLSKRANEFVKANSLGFIRLGVAQANKMSDGLAFTGQTAQADRADPSDTSLEQPLFRRRIFDDGGVSDFTDDAEVT
jgi:hypothetical protein